ncbi:MAG: hypothetical protein HY851_05965 [candidate division Zixibacteria bacterium]|nr:hypothetical protein [candidate division Zixibacteria bacterium]
MVCGFCSRRWRRAVVTLLSLVFVLAMASSVSALPDIIVTVGDTTGNPGQKNSAITVYLDNFKDTISAFELWLQLNRPDIMIFQTDTQRVIDTTYWKCDLGTYPNCSHEVATDSAHAQKIKVDTVLAVIGNIDTAHTLISGWDLVVTRSMSGTKYDIKVTALADDLAKPGTRMGIKPQQGGVLFRLRGDILNIPLDMMDRTVKIKPNADVVQGFFNFSRPNGTAIGIVSVVAPDTNYYRCTSRLPAPPYTCMQWTKVAGPPYDSVVIKLDTTGYLDTNKVKLYTGSLTVLSGWVCGNVDGEMPAGVDISDLTYLIGYMFMGGPAPIALQTGNCDCSPDGNIDISDLTALIDNLFISLNPLCCQTGG